MGHSTRKVLQTRGENMDFVLSILYTFRVWQLRPYVLHHVPMMFMIFYTYWLHSMELEHTFVAEEV